MKFLPKTESMMILKNEQFRRLLIDEEVLTVYFYSYVSYA